MNLLEKIRKQSKARKKIIIWSIIIAAALIFFLFYVRNIRKGIERYRAENFGEKIDFPSFGEGLDEIEQNLKKLDEQKQATTTE